MKVWFDTVSKLGIAMHRIEGAIKKYKPDDVYFVNNFDDADIAFHHIIGKTDESDTSLINAKPYVIVFHCFEKGWVNQDGISEDNLNDEFYKQLFKNALAVITFLPLHKWFEGNFIFTPWGVDSDRFYLTNEDDDREYLSMMTGYVSKTEAIEEMWLATKEVGGKALHVGKYMDFGDGYVWTEGVSDRTMRDFYNSTVYVSGLRRSMGFEMPVLEGALCGARPICFDTPCYYWFKDFALYVPETGTLDEGVDSELVENLKKILEQKHPRLGHETIQEIQEKFDWRILCNRIWQLIPSSRTKVQEMILAGEEGNQTWQTWLENR